MATIESVEVQKLDFEQGEPGEWTMTFKVEPAQEGMGRTLCRRCPIHWSQHPKDAACSGPQGEFDNLIVVSFPETDPRGQSPTIESALTDRPCGINVDNMAVKAVNRALFLLYKR